MQVPKVVPVSDMANRQQAVLAMADDAPVVLAQRSKARAVLVSVEEWNRRDEELNRFRKYWQNEAQRIEAMTSDDGWHSLQDIMAEVSKRQGNDVAS